MAEIWLLYEGERGGTFSLNSRVTRDHKYQVTSGVPFKVQEGDLWIASIPGYTVLSEVDFVPTTKRQPVPDESYLTRWEGAFLEGLAASTPDPSRCVEIGTGKGASLARILTGLALHNDAFVWSIDLVECKKAADHIVSCQIPNWRYEFLLGDSVAIGDKWNKPLDMLYVDGSHSYEGIIKDIRTWYYKLNADCIIAFHDYGNRKHTVTAAVDDVAKEFGLKKVGRAGFLVAFEKVG